MRRRSSVTAALAAGTLALGLLVACTKIEARDAIRDGNAAYAAGRYEEAIQLYTRSLELEPEGVMVLWNRACAAESLVLALRDAANEQQVASRKEWADRALADLDAWHGKLRERTESDDQLYAEHRLAVLKADNRCDDLVHYWTDKHRLEPQNENLYSVISRTHEEVCQQADKAEEWLVKRTQDFPKSEKAWYTLAVRRFQPLFPDVGSDKPFNDALPPATRIQIANEVIGLLQNSTALRDSYRDPYIWRAMAYTQRSFARIHDQAGLTLEDKRQALLAREDLMLAWKEQKAVCDLDSLPDCAIELSVDEIATKRESIGDHLALLSGKVVPESLVKDEALSVDGKRVFKMTLRGTPPAPPNPPKGNPKKVGDPVEAPAVAGEAPTFAVVFEFPPLSAEAIAAGQSDPAVAAYDVWHEGKSAQVQGRFVGETFVGGPIPSVACCPLPPLLEVEYAAERQQLKEIEAQIAAAQAAADQPPTKPGKRGGSK